MKPRSLVFLALLLLPVPLPALASSGDGAEVIGKYEVTKEDRDVFENLIIGALAGRIDRGKFTSEAWASYMQHLEAIEEAKDAIHNAESVARTIPRETVRFSAAGDDLEFSADGSYAFWQTDELEGSKPFNLAVEFTPLEPFSPENILIKKWRADICEDGEWDCLYRTAIKYDPSGLISGDMSAPNGPELQETREFGDRVDHEIYTRLNLFRDSSIFEGKDEILVRRALEANKKYFTDLGWKNYLSYAVSALGQSTCGGITSIIDRDSLKFFDAGQGEKYVLAKGVFDDAGGFALCHRGYISYQGKFRTVDDERGPQIIFSAWSAQLCNENNPNCSGKDSKVALSDREKNKMIAYIKSFLDFNLRMLRNPPSDTHEIDELLHNKKKYFSDAAWAEYLAFVQGQFQTGNDINAFVISPENTTFIDDKFSGQGTYIYIGRPINNLNDAGQFKISLELRRDPAFLMPIITKWHIELLRPSAADLKTVHDNGMVMCCGNARPKKSIH